MSESKFTIWQRVPRDSDVVLRPCYVAARGDCEPEAEGFESWYQVDVELPGYTINAVADNMISDSLIDPAGHVCRLMANGRRGFWVTPMEGPVTLGPYVHVDEPEWDDEHHRFGACRGTIKIN